MINVFVYGSLMKNYWNHHYLKDSEFLGQGTLNGYEMYQVSSFPGIVKKPGENVLGEIYSIDEATLKALDRLEHEGYMYVRKEENLNIKNEVLKAYVYVWNQGIIPGYKKVKTMPWMAREG